MAIAWTKGLLKKKEPPPKRVPACEHDTEDEPLVPLLPKNITNRLEMSWRKPQDAGLLRAGNQMYRKMLETLTPEQMKELDQIFAYMDTNKGYASLAASRPFKDKCYYLLRVINDLLNLLWCVPCFNDKVDEVLHGNSMSEHHYNMLKDYIIWILEVYNGQYGFTNRKKAAWGVFFACIWDAMDGSPPRYKTKQLELARKRAEEEKKAEEERAKQIAKVGGKCKVTKTIKFDREMKKVKHHNVVIPNLKFDDIGVDRGGDNTNENGKTQGTEEEKDKEKDDKAKAKEGDGNKGIKNKEKEDKGKEKGKKDQHSDKKEGKDKQKA